ncbi:alpha/beta-hydrolase [Clavulina sp. PMI_390]|nr:alpha/beta-hydrolase [Clavulina sp. PMI_390]
MGSTTKWKRTSVILAVLSALTRSGGVLAQSPTVTLGQNTTVVGIRDSFGLEEFLGIPYAQPPLGNLRYAAPSPVLLNASSVVNATAYGPVCVQDPTYFDVSQMSEDCLSINVIRPPGLNSTAQLPVMVWIFGGSFIEGGSPLYPAGGLVARSILLNMPVIYVSFNYRLNSFGFLASSELADAAQNGTAALNAGLYDIQAALLWVQQNIASFGGDPEKVCPITRAFGESAGAISIGSLLVAGGGQAVQKLGLFRAAIMESGAPSGHPVPPPEYLNPRYELFATAAGCGSGLANSSALACLRSASTAVLYNATIYALTQRITPGPSLSLPFARVVDGYFHNTQASQQVRSEAVATVPLLMGNNLDEGTIFASTAVTNASELPLVIERKADPPTVKVCDLLELYPDDPSLGSPYAPINVSLSYRFFPPLTTNQFKRFAAMLGDSIFQAGRRLLLDAYIAKNQSYPAWNYLFVQNTPGANPAKGVYHASEIPFVYGGYAFNNATTIEGQTSLFMLDAWITFANTMSPNGPNRTCSFIDYQEKVDCSHIPDNLTPLSSPYMAYIW